MLLFYLCIFFFFFRKRKLYLILCEIVSLRCRLDKRLTLISHIDVLTFFDIFRSVALIRRYYVYFVFIKQKSMDAILMFAMVYVITIYRLQDKSVGTQKMSNSNVEKI